MKQPPIPKPTIVAAVAAAIRRIPRGRVSTYGAVAEAAGYPRCARQVSRVLKQVLGLPWQRVLGSGGRISLRGEDGFEQRFLLESEGVRFKGRRVDLSIYEHRFLGSRDGASSGKRRAAVPRK